MQSFKLHIVSEHLKTRHPYLELQFRDRYDPSEVYHAVFDRAIPKLVEILQMRNLPSEKYRDALITLTEQSAHQENKDQMINQNLVQITSYFLHHEDAEIRHEAVIVLGSLISIMRGREMVVDETFTGLEKLLFDENLLVREACAWCICRFASGRDGVESMSNKGLISKIVKSFLTYSEPLEIENGKFLVYLLEGFLNLFQFDNGIVFFLKSGLMKKINSILQTNQDNEFINTFANRIHYLCFATLAKITVNPDGKQEAIEERVIETANTFLQSANPEEVHYAVVLIMNCTIHLDGKKQCVEYRDHIVIKNLIDLITPSLDPILRLNIKQTLTNIADLPLGFHVIAQNLSKNVKILEEIFGPRSVKPLSELLPSPLPSPPNIPPSLYQDSKNICQAICYLIKNHKEAIRIVGEETVKTAEKILPFLGIRSEKGFQEQVATTLFKICQYDEYSRKPVRKYLENFGDVEFDMGGGCLNKEIKKFRELNEIIDEKNDDYQ